MHTIIINADGGSDGIDKFKHRRITLATTAVASTGLQPPLVLLVLGYEANYKWIMKYHMNSYQLNKLNSILNGDDDQYRQYSCY